eukprot:COSAG02_NODE_3679_length_6390_cov_3.572405_3_plen_566_part_00
MHRSTRTRGALTARDALLPFAELDAAAEQADPSRRGLSSKKKKKSGDDHNWASYLLYYSRLLLCMVVPATCMLLAREMLTKGDFKKRGAKQRGKGGSQPGGRRAKSERETPPRPQKKKERSSSSDGNPDQAAKRDTKANKSVGKGSSKASPESNQKSEPKARPESPRSQAKREERSRQKKEQRDRQKEKSRQESMRAEAEALAKAKAAAQSAARRSAAALAALEEATAAEAAAEAEALREKAEEAAARREAAKEAELAARAEAKQAKLNLKKRARKAAAKIKAANTGGTGSPAQSQQAVKQQATKQKQKQQRSNETTSDATRGGSKLPSPGSSGSLSSMPDLFQPTFEPQHSLGVDWSHTDGGGAVGSMVSRLSSGSNSSFGSDDLGQLGAGTDNGDLDIDVFAVLQDEIMSRDLGLDGASADGSGKGTLDESRLLSNLVDFLDTDESDTESLADSSYSGDDFFGPFDSGAAANQLSASAPEFTPTGPAEGHKGDVSTLSVEVWMEAHDLSQYTSNLLDAGLKTVGDLLAMPLTHDHLKSLGLTKLRGRLLLMNSLKSNRQRQGE